MADTQALLVQKMAELGKQKSGGGPANASAAQCAKYVKTYNKKLEAELAKAEDEAARIVALKKHVSALASEKKQFELEAISAN
eukprot:gene28758-28997_t